MNINPDYQREVVWSEARMIHLIDSLFNNYYVPPLIFKVVTGNKPGTNERRKWRTCIDGKQRLTAIRMFFDGEIPYVDKRRQKWYYRRMDNETGNRARRIIPDEEKEFIENVQIVNIEFEQLNDQQEEDMFQRVQLGVPLTVAEKLAALTGFIPSFINDLRTTFPAIPAHIGKKRSLDFQLMAQLVYILYNLFEDGNNRIASSQALKKFLEEKDYAQTLTPAFRTQVRNALTLFTNLLHAHPDVFTHTFGGSNSRMRKFAPVEFLAVGLMLFTYPERPSRVLADDIQEFRRHLRQQLQDLRTNPRTWEEVTEYIETLEDTRGRYAPAKGQPTRARDAHIQPSPPRQNVFNPPPPERQLQPSHRHTVFNERQQHAMQARLGAQEREEQGAFRTIPSTRVEVGYSSPAKAIHSVTRKRSLNGTIKKERTG
jgi:Protein of unknown function DUF262